MNVTVYVPKDLEAELVARAERAKVTPSLWIQGVVREALSRKEPRFSEKFMKLAGCWDDETAQQIRETIKRNRRNVPRREKIK